MVIYIIICIITSSLNTYKYEQVAIIYTYVVSKIKWSRFKSLWWNMRRRKGGSQEYTSLIWINGLDYILLELDMDLWIWHLEESTHFLFYYLFIYYFMMNKKRWWYKQRKQQAMPLCESTSIRSWLWVRITPSNVPLVTQPIR